MNKKIVSRAVAVLSAAALPFLLGFVYCLVRGVSIFDLYLPSSINNDCAFYYKLVDAATKMWSPAGYFGFNESHALIGGYAAWSPFILLPWTLFGKIAGWSYSSAIVCNLVLCALAFALFVYFADIGLKEIILVAISLFLFPSFSIHLLNLLPEIVLGSFCLVYLGLAVGVAKRGFKMSYVVAMLAIACYLTLTRPYMVLFVILPAYYLGKGKRKTAGILTFVTVSVLALAGNLLIGHFFTSAYFTPLYETEIVELVFRGKFVDAFWKAAHVFSGMSKRIIEAVGSAFSYGLTMGTQYVAAILTAVIAFALAFDKKDSKLRPVYFFFSGSTFVVLLAVIFFLQRPIEGARHLWVFALMGIVLCCIGGVSIVFSILKGCLIALFAFFCFRGAMVPTDYDIPIERGNDREAVAWWEDFFAGEELFDEDAGGYDNTVMWVYMDSTEDSYVATAYYELYALPAGTAVSCCLPEYAIVNFDSLKSKYVITDDRGNVSKLCESRGLKVVGRHEHVIMYQRY